MMSNKKYPTEKIIGLVVEQDPSGNYLPQAGAKPHTWRIGKHTKGKFSELGQVFLTENGQAVAVIDRAPLAFNQRHDYQPLARWTSGQVDIMALQAWITYKND